METRTVTQVKVYKLMLNRMTTPKIEYNDIAAIAYSKQDIIDFCEDEKERWTDGQWYKSYKRGSILEWFNTPSSYDKLDVFGHGIVEEWVDDDALQNFIDGNPALVINTQELQ